MLRNQIPNLLTSTFFDDIFTNVADAQLAAAYKRTTHGYPVVDILKHDDGSVTMEFALAGFRKSDLSIDVSPEKNTITVAASAQGVENVSQRRIARRDFVKSYVNYDSALDVANTTAKFEDGLLTVTIPPRPATKSLAVEIS
jgi:HSP20 family molecular chaperone IbpA